MSKKIFIERIDIIEFGKLKNLTITPSDGLNLITAPNESGKTTLAAFIKFILYGFVGTQKSSPDENERTLYSPWSGGTAAGGLTICVDDKRFRVERSVNGNKKTLETYEVATKKPVSTPPGEFFCNLNEESFNKILFFKQLYIPKNNDSALAWQVQNLMFSADEEVSADNSVKALKEAMSELQNRQKRGKIPRLEAYQEEIERRYEKAVEVNREIAEVTAIIKSKADTITAKEAELHNLHEEKENILKYEALLRLGDYIKTADALEIARENHRKALQNFRDGNPPDGAATEALIADETEHKLCCQRIEELATRITEEDKSLSKIKNDSPFFRINPQDIAKKYRKYTIVFISIVALIVAAILGFGALNIAMRLFFSMNYAYIAGAVGIAVTIFGFRFIQQSTAKKLGFASKSALDTALAAFPVTRVRAEEQRERINNLERQYNDCVASKGEIEQRMDERLKDFMDGEGDYKPRIQNMLRAINEISTLNTEYVLLQNQFDQIFGNDSLESLRIASQGAVQPRREKLEVERYIAFTQQSIKALDQQKIEYEKRLAALLVNADDPATLFGKNEGLKRNIADLKQKYSALELAVEVLEASRDHMKSTVSPKLAELATQYFSIATHGKYNALSLSSDYFMEFEAQNATHSVDFLSCGARDAVYLSLRLALVELLYGEMRPFIVLDDAFSRIDAHRLENILKMLAALSQQGQIFLFTCHNRESEILAKIGASTCELSGISNQ